MKQCTIDANDQCGELPEKPVKGSENLSRNKEGEMEGRGQSIPGSGNRNKRGE